jgi:hypothetical protein
MMPAMLSQIGQADGQCGIGGCTAVFGLLGSGRQAAKMKIASTWKCRPMWK